MLLTVLDMVVCIFSLRNYFSLEIYPFLVTQLFVILFCVAFGAIVMSNVFHISSKFRWNMQKNMLLLTRGRRDIAKRTLISCPILKCKVGTFYYMEGKAKLTLADMILNAVAFVVIS